MISGYFSKIFGKTNLANHKTASTFGECKNPPTNSIFFLFEKSFSIFLFILS